MNLYKLAMNFQLDIDLIYSYLCGHEFVQIGTLIEGSPTQTLREKKGMYTTLMKTYSSFDGDCSINPLRERERRHNPVRYPI